MAMPMNCKQAQRDIALWAGHDLDDASQREAVRQHVTGCPCCRAHYQRMKETLHVLERAERPVTYISQDSLWPDLATRISRAQHASPVRNTRRFHGWMPLIAMTAAGFILLLVVYEQPQPARGPIHGGFSPSPVISAESPSADHYRSYSEYSSVDDRDVEDEIRRLKELRLEQLRKGF